MMKVLVVTTRGPKLPKLNLGLRFLKKNLRRKKTYANFQLSIVLRKNFGKT